MSAIRLLDVTWRDVEEAIPQTQLALVPVGAVEVYGPHLPQGTDGLVAEALCVAAAEELGCFVAPLIPIGWSRPLSGFPGTLNVSPDAIKEYCRGVCESLIGWGVSSILLVNGHLGNVPPIDQLCFELSERHDVRLAQIDIWRFIQPITSDLLESPEWKFGHAGEAMTAFMLYLRPELVRLERLDGAETVSTVDKFGLSRPHAYRELLPTGLLGDARAATAKKGEEMFAATVREVVDFLRAEGFVRSTALASAGSPT